MVVWAQWPEESETLVEDGVARMRGRGLEGEVVVLCRQKYSVRVRDGKLVERGVAVTTGLGVRLFQGQKSAYATTNRATVEGLLSLLQETERLISSTAPDPALGLPEPEWCVVQGASSSLLDPCIVTLTSELALSLAMECELAAQSADPRVVQSNGAMFSAEIERKWLGSTRNPVCHMETGNVSLAVRPIAVQGTERREGFWFDQTVSLSHLESPEHIGQESARRLVRMLGAGRPATGRWTMLFPPETGHLLLELLFQCAAADNVCKGDSYLKGSVGKRIGSPLLHLTDDPHQLSGLGAAWHDGEGVATRASTLVNEGVLQFHPSDSYSARRLGLASTGHSRRRLTEKGTVSPHNLALRGGSLSEQELIAATGNGIYITGFQGFGFDKATGGFSRGAEGILIQNGELTTPVRDFTLSGFFDSLWNGLTGVANQVDWRYGTGTPTFVLHELAVAGR